MFKRKLNWKNVITVVLTMLAIIATFIYLSVYSKPNGVNGDMMYIDEESIVTTTLETTTTTVTTVTSAISQTTTAVTSTTTTTTTTTTVATTTTTEPEVEECIAVQSGTTYTETIQTVDDTCYYFYPYSYRVHTADCYYADPSCMERIDGDYIDTARRCAVCNPEITIGNIYQPTYEETDYSYSESLTQNWSVNEMTYYSGPWGCYGASGRTLVNNYSCACNSIPLGTIVYITSSDGSIDGYYRVDDTGAMGYNVIDIFYSDYSYVPEPFATNGRVSCEVYIVE